MKTKFKKSNTEDTEERKWRPQRVKADAEDVSKREQKEIAKIAP